MSTLSPRVVFVTRPTRLELLVARHGTLSQARFFLRTREQSIDPLRDEHEQATAALATGRRTVPRAWRQAQVTRDDLCRFVFEPQDIVVAIGQDGLVANVAKYLTGQPVVGVNPHAGRPGVLVRHRADDLPGVLAAAGADELSVEVRTMVQAQTDDGQRLCALNEIFVGHRSHQSARYCLELGGEPERQSSSGVIVTTGTGASGWSRSIYRERGTSWALPEPTEPSLAFFVREAWPSPWTRVDTTEGRLDGTAPLVIRSEMDEGGVVFGDGIEKDRFELRFGATVTMTRAPHALKLVA